MGYCQIPDKKNVTYMQYIKTLFKTLFLIYLGMVFFFSLHTFTESPVDFSWRLFGVRADRIMHFIMFFPFPFSAWFAFGHKLKEMSNRYSYLLLLISGIAISTLTEFLQKAMPGREYDLVDLLANYSAIITGSVLVIILDKYAKSIWPGRLQ